MDKSLIYDVEQHGEFIDAYPVDESQQISNAGDASRYEYGGSIYEIITWNQCADEHEPESKTISELDID